MNNSKFLALILFMAVAGSASAQSTAIKVNLLSPVVRTFNIAAEQKIAENASLQLGFFYGGVKVDDTKFSGWGLTPEYRYYLSSTPAPAGFYLAPYLRYQQFNVTDPGENNTTNKGTLSSFGGGLVVGKQWLFKERVTLDLFIGPKYMSHTAKVTQGVDTFSSANGFGNFGIRGGVTLGIAF